MRSRCLQYRISRSTELFGTHFEISKVTRKAMEGLEAENVSAQSSEDYSANPI